MKENITFFWLLLGITILQAQPRSATFYKDTVSQAAIIVWFNKADSIVYRLPDDKSFQLYRASDLDSVLIHSKGIYHAKTMIENSQQVQKFLRHAYDGAELELFELEKTKTFFLAKEQALIPLTGDKSTLSQTLSEISQRCMPLNRRVARVRANEKSLSFFLKQLEDCRYQLFPYPRAGLVAGTTRWRASSFFPDLDKAALKTVELTYGPNYLVGLFGEMPINWSRHWYLRGELLYSRQNFRLYHNNNLENHNILIDFARIEIPIQVCYFTTIGYVHPYVSAGVHYLQYFSNKAEEAYARQDTYGWTWQIGTPFEVSTRQLGYTLGAGVMIPLNARNMLSLQGRFSQVSSFISAKNAPASGFYSLSTGINW